MVKSRQRFDDLDEFIRRKHASLARALRPLYPWAESSALAHAIYDWAGRGRGLSRIESDEIAEAFADMDLSDWTVSAVARLGIRLAWGVRRNGFASPPEYWDAAVWGVSESTLGRHRHEGIKYGYERLAREIDVQRLMEGGRTERAALRWLQRASEAVPAHEALHWWDAPKPRQRRQLRPVAARPAPETRRTRRAGRAAA